MQILQLCWDESDQNSLLFKFKKEKTEENEIIEENVEKVQIKFELLKKHELSPQIIQEPFLISIKDIFFSAHMLAFSVKLDKLNDLEDLQIKVIRLTIFYYSGQREDIFINRTYQLTEISYDDGQFIETTEEEIIYEKKTTYSYRKKSVSNKAYQAHRKKKRNTSQKNSQSLAKRGSSGNPEEIIPVSQHEFQQWLELKGDKTWDTTLFQVRQGFNKIKELEKELKVANKTLRKIALNKSNAPSGQYYLQPPPNISDAPKLSVPSKRRTTPSVNRKHSLEDPNAQKVLREKKDSSSMSKQIEVMREMKGKFEKIKDVKELLSKVPEEELKKKRAKTDHAAFLEFKRSRSQTN
jgi:hypothetical protein